MCVYVHVSDAETLAHYINLVLRQTTNKIKISK